MAEIIGNIATQPEWRTSRSSRGEFVAFRLAENSGKGEHRRTTWYDVLAKIPRAQANLLSVGQLVRVRGRLEPQAFIRRKALERIPVPSSWDAVVQLLKEREALGSAFTLLTSSVEPYEMHRRGLADSAEHGLGD